MFFGDAVPRQRLLALTARVEGADSAASLRAIMKADAAGAQASASPELSAGQSAGHAAGRSAGQAAATPAASGGMADVVKVKVQQARRAAYARGDAMLAGILNQWLMRYGRP